LGDCGRTNASGCPPRVNRRKRRAVQTVGSGSGVRGKKATARLKNHVLEQQRRPANTRRRDTAHLVWPTWRAMCSSGAAHAGNRLIRYLNAMSGKKLTSGVTNLALCAAVPGAMIGPGRALLFATGFIPLSGSTLSDCAGVLPCPFRILEPEFWGPGRSLSVASG
jgi:hypothetical protein